MSETHPALISPLSFEQSRVLGCLLEKEVLVPDSYPLTLNTLVTACNQSTNRDPVTNLDETIVIRALDGLRETQWAFQLSQAGARVPKFKHNLHAKIHDLSPAAVAILCILLLRGHQTAGELRQRCERMHAFPDLPSIEIQLEALQNHPEGPLIVCLPSGNGRRVPAYAHLFCGPVDPFSPSASSVPATTIVPPPAPPIDPDWKERIESELATLRAELAELKSQLGL